MEKLQLIFLSIFILCSFNLFAQDSTRVEKDSINVTSKKLNFSIFGGVGIIPANSVFGLSFNTTPIQYLGLEIPITKSNNWTFQLKSHLWVAKSGIKPSETLYYKLSENYYGQLALSAYLKWFYLNIGDFRSSMQFGYYSSLWNQGTYNGLDLGLSIDYSIDKDLNVSLIYNLTDYKGDHTPGTWTLFNHFYSSIAIYLYFNLGI